MPEDERSHLHAWLLPWGELDDTTEFGEITFWDFYREGPNRVAHSGEMLRLAQFISCIKNHVGDDMRSVYVIQNGPIPFASQLQKGNEKVRFAALALFFCHFATTMQAMIADANCNLPYPASERFHALAVVVDLEEERVYYARPFSGGVDDLPAKGLLFFEPYFLPEKRSRPDRPLLECLGKLNDQKHDTEIWETVRICLESVSNAFTASDDISDTTRFVSMMTAFESLARKTNEDTAKDMGNFASTYCDWGSFPHVQYKTPEGKETGSNKAVKFIIDYGMLRNRFVHGGAPNHSDKQYQFAGRARDQRLVMGAVVYQMLANLMLKEVPPDEACALKLKSQMKALNTALEWNKK